MSDLAVEVHWHRNTPDFVPGGYSAEHKVTYNAQSELYVDAAPDWGGAPENTNPEQALAAALSSCHMMTFLALCAKAGWPVASYHDYAEAHLGKNPKGQMAVTQIDLNPVVRFDTGFSVSDADLNDMQHRAHRYCFIANSLSDSVTVNVR